jgi:mono/diheme cytochrome c family protein
MRRSGKKGTTASLVLVWFGRTRLRSAQTALFGALCAAGLFAAACDKRGQLTEWRPEDHQPPPTALPEGQGVAEETGDPTARAAAALWSMRCASCHGEGGRGDGPSKPPGAALPDFTEAAFHTSRSDAQLYQTISNGRNLMPAFGKEFTEQGIEALVGHLRGLRAR